MRHIPYAILLTAYLSGTALAHPRPARHAAVPAQAPQEDVAAMPRLPSQPAFQTRSETSAACAGGARLLSHAAYTPAVAPVGPCSQPLSTDTLVTAHRWNQT